MGLREKINQNPAVAGGVTAAVLLIALVWIVMSMGGGGGTGEASSKDLYTIDDGATYFEDEAFPQRVVPYQKDGKTAYRAIVWTCDGGKTKLVSGVQRFTAVAKTKLQGLVDAKNFNDPTIGIVIETWEGSEVKPPKTGDTGWMPYNDPRAANLTAPPCPPGSTQERVGPK